MNPKQSSIPSKMITYKLVHTDISTYDFTNGFNIMKIENGPDKPITILRTREDFENFFKQ